MRRSPILWVGVATVWIVCFGLAIGLTVNIVHRGTLGADAHAYWLTGSESHFYLRPPQSRDAYLYSPVFAQVLWPLTQLPWGWFRALWMVAEEAAFAWLLAPLGWRWAPPMLALTAIEAGQGNIWGFLGVAAVLGFRRPECWALAELTKISLSLGPVWFAVRREWRALLQSVWPAAVIAAISFVAAPHEWTEWLRFLRHHGGSGGALLYVRVAIGAVIAAVAARMGRPWLLVFAMLIAAPVLHGVGFLSLLAAVPRMQSAHRASCAQDPTISKIVADP
jgi:hypothetical protein